MKKPKIKINVNRERELLELVNRGEANNYRFKTENGEMKIFPYYVDKEKALYEGVEALFIKKALDNRNKNLKSDINEKELMREFKKYSLDSWINSGKVGGNHYSQNYNWTVENKETGVIYNGKEASYLVTLMTLEEARRKKVKMSASGFLIYTLENDNIFSSIRELMTRCGKNIKDFSKDYKGKTTSVDKLFIELTKSLFPYKIPAHFLKEMIEQSSPKITVTGDGGYRHRKVVNETPSSAKDEWKRFFTMNGEEVTYIDLKPSADFKNIHFLKNDVWAWSSLIGNGYSFHKTVGKHFFTKSESHYFANPPVNLKVAEAIIFAVAFSHSKDYSHSLKIAKITQLHDAVMKAISTPTQNYKNFFGLDLRKIKFLFDIVRLMSADNTFKDVKKLEEIADFFILGYYPRILEKMAKDGHADSNIEIFGRKLTMSRLYVETIAWHHELNRKTAMGNSSWEGLPLENLEVNRVEFNVNIKYVFNQILTASALQEEGAKMRHCVSSYVPRCASGSIAIFSLMKVNPNGKEKKMLTIEVSNAGNILQVKGLANRAPKPEEKTLVSLFARHNYLTWY